MLETRTYRFVMLTITS